MPAGAAGCCTDIRPAAAVLSQLPPAERDVESNVPLSSDMEARPDVHGVTHEPPPEGMQPGQVRAPMMLQAFVCTSCASLMMGFGL